MVAFVKTRRGFVSNSSSTAFILDYGNQAVKEWVRANRPFIKKAVDDFEL